MSVAGLVLTCKIDSRMGAVSVGVEPDAAVMVDAADHDGLSVYEVGDAAVYAIIDENGTVMVDGSVSVFGGVGHIPAEIVVLVGHAADLIFYEPMTGH